MADQITLLYKAAKAKIDAIELDAALTESHVGEVEVTEHPVEKGYSVTDHTRPKPAVLTIEGIVSNTPLSRQQQRRTVERLGVRLTTSTIEDQVQGRPGYAEDAYLRLLDLKEAGNPITVVTGLRSYSNMVLTSLTVPRDGTTGDVLQFSATFREVVIVANKSTTIKVTKQPRGQPTIKAGKQGTSATDTSTKRKSIAFQAADAFGLLGKMGIK